MKQMVKKPTTRALAFRNIELCIAAVLRQSCQYHLTPTPEEVFLGEYPALLRMLHAIVEAFLVTQVIKIAPKLLSWFDGALRSKGRSLSVTSLRSPYDSLWDELRDTTLIMTALDAVDPASQRSARRETCVTCLLPPRPAVFPPPLLPALPRQLLIRSAGLCRRRR